MDFSLGSWAECKLSLLDIEGGSLFVLVVFLIIESAHPHPFHHGHCSLQRLLLPMLPLEDLSSSGGYVLVYQVNLVLIQALLLID